MFRFLKNVVATHFDASNKICMKIFVQLKKWHIARDLFQKISRILNSKIQQAFSNIRGVQER